MIVYIIEFVLRGLLRLQPVTETAVPQFSGRRGEQAKSSENRQNITQEFSDRLSTIQHRLLDRLHPSNAQLERRIRARQLTAFCQSSA